MHVLILKGLAKGFDGCVDCRAFRRSWRNYGLLAGHAGVKAAASRRTPNWTRSHDADRGAPRKARAGRVPGGWTQVFTSHSIVHQEGLVKIIIYWEAGFWGEKQGREKRDSSDKKTRDGAGFIALETRNNMWRTYGAGDCGCSWSQPSRAGLTYAAPPALEPNEEKGAKRSV
jgi:hypothetical protein